MAASVSELRKGARANQSVATWFDGIESAEIHLPVPSFGEIRRGWKCAAADLTVVTRNVKGIQRAGARVLKPFGDSAARSV